MSKFKVGDIAVFYKIQRTDVFGSLEKLDFTLVFISKVGRNSVITHLGQRFISNKNMWFSEKHVWEHDNEYILVKPSEIKKRFIEHGFELWKKYKKESLENRLKNQIKQKIKDSGYSRRGHDEMMIERINFEINPEILKEHKDVIKEIIKEEGWDSD
jgi:hypothetical protein